MSESYRGKTAVVTGARTGLGKEIAAHLLAHGAEVVGLGRRPGSIQHPRYTHKECDVRSDQEVRAVFRGLKQETLDIVVNNAGVTAYGITAHSLLLNDQVAQNILTTNVLGPLFVTRAAFSRLKRSAAGRVINIGSMAAPLEPVGDSVYAASKSGLATLTNVLAKEFAGYGITCNLIGVTAIETDMLSDKDSTALRQAIESLPLPRSAEPDDVLNVIDFLASARSSYITAQAIYLGGCPA